MSSDNLPSLPDDAPGEAYSTLNDAWRAYQAAIAEGDTERAKQFACVINGVRASFGQEPMAFDSLDGYKCNPLAQPVDLDSYSSEMDSEYCLSILPKGSSCQDYKDVPAKSSYWRDDTDAVQRCAGFQTGGGRTKPDRDPSDSGTGADDEKADGLTEKEKLMKIDGVGEERAKRLLDRFGSVRNVSKAAASNWDEIRKVDGFSKKTAKNFFDKMQDAGVFEKGGSSTPKRGKDTDPDDKDDDGGSVGPNLPDDIDGWALRHDKNGVYSYVAETGRAVSHGWSTTSKIVTEARVDAAVRTDIEFYIVVHNTSAGKSKRKEPGRGYDQEFTDPKAAIRELKKWCRDAHNGRSIAAPEENGFVNVTSSRRRFDWIRSEVPESADYDSVQLYCQWFPHADDAPERPYWKVWYEYRKDGQEKPVRDGVKRDSVPHVKDAISVAKTFMQNYTADVDLPSTIGPWELMHDEDRSFEYRADTKRDVPQSRGSPKRLHKWVRASRTVSGWVVRLQKGFEDEQDDPDNRKTVDELETVKTKVGAANFVRDYLEDHDDVDESEEKQDIPSSVNGWKNVAAEDAGDAGIFAEPVYAWEAADGETHAYIAESTKEDPDKRYKTGINSPNSGITFSNAETLADALDIITAKMEQRDPDMPEARFDIRLSNAVMKPYANLHKWAGSAGSGSVSASTRSAIEIHEDSPIPSVDGPVCEIRSNAFTSGMRVYIPSEAVEMETADDEDAPETRFDVERYGSFTFDGEISADTYAKGKKSEMGRLWTEYDDNIDTWKVRAGAGYTTRSSKTGSPITDTSTWPEKPEDVARVETTGRELNSAVKALAILADSRTDDLPVKIEVDDDEMKMGIRNSAEETGKATIGAIEDDAEVSGDYDGAFLLKQLYNVFRSVPKPASTTVQLQFGHGNRAVTATWKDEGATYQAMLAEPSEVEEFDMSLSMAEEIDDSGWHLNVLGCPFEGDDWQLGEPISIGEPAPDVDGMELASGDSVVWFFPNTDGCRCGAQAQGYERLQAATDATVYGVANSPAAELEEMQAAHDLNITLISDTDGLIADEFGVETVDGGYERKTFFVRDGNVLDMSDGMTGQTLSQPREAGSCPLEAKPDPRVFTGPTADLIGPQALIFGDPDNDDIPNVDDKNPFRPNADDRFYEEISLADDVLERVQDVSQRHRDVFNEVVDAWDIKKGRVKQPVSILEKLVRKYLDELDDIVGVTIYEPNHKKVLEKAEKIKSEYDIIEYDDYIADPKNDVYYAYHLIVDWQGPATDDVDGGLEVEVQIKTPDEAKLQGEMHEAYKQGKDLAPFERKAKELAEKLGTEETNSANDEERDNKPSPEPEDALELPDGGTLQQGGLHENLLHPGVYVITGKRGAGKSAAAMQIAEKHVEQYDIKAVTVGMPEKIREKFPGHWLHVDTIKDAPNDSILVIDESYMQYNARNPMQERNKKLIEYVNTSRHTQQSMLFVTQNSATLDKNAVGEADGILIKKPGTLHTRFERAPIRKLTEKADDAFKTLPDDLTVQRYGYLVTDDFEGMVSNEMPEWYDDDVSRSYMEMHQCCMSD